MQVHVTPITIIGYWNVDPAILTVLAIVAGLYLWGSNRQKPDTKIEPAISRVRAIAFWSAVGIVVAVSISPLGELAAVLFSGHMIQHMLLTLVAAPLFVLSAPGRVLADALPRPVLALSMRAARNPHSIHFGSIISRPLTASILYAAVLWVWSLPPLYAAAQDHRSLHLTEHLVLLGASLLFWWSMLRRSRIDGKQRGLGERIILVLITALSNSVLGAILAFASQPWYPQYVMTAPRWGLAPLMDQQIAGLVVWIPSAAIFTVTAGVLFVAWLNVLERDVRERERRAREEYRPPQPYWENGQVTVSSRYSSKPGLAEVTNSGD